VKQSQDIPSFLKRRSLPTYKTGRKTTLNGGKLIVYITALLIAFSLQAKSKLSKNDERKCIELIRDTLSKLNLHTIKMMKDYLNEKIFIDTNEYNLSVDYLIKGNPILKTKGLKEYLSVLNDTFYYKPFLIKKTFIKKTLSKKRILCDFNTFENNAQINDAYFKFSKFMIYKYYKILFIDLEVKSEMTYYSNILVILSNDCKIIKLICYDEVH
jgi:hypothetical protein